ncbi:glutathione S-transferase family protein [Flocculibacter collagenilyticus]|uniref:glutathione S-transferase family protein n=1 Tax=Flocculibacter collagenilyticus TaxID=2744479 RepID=UPI0018F7C6FB|nr:glutathione S-transferase family protein [Flocculibacter collagenilyticus]
MAIIYGVEASPYVRKTLLAHQYKEAEYELKMTVPHTDDADFKAASPFGKIPGYKTDDGFAFSDSSVIIAYLEKTNQHKPLYPSDVNDYAFALWLEEFGDTKMMEATAGLYYQRIIGPMFFEHKTDPERVAELTDELIPAVLDYVEQLLEKKPADQTWIVGNDLSVGELAIATNLFNLQHADFNLDENKWPLVVKFKKQLFELEFVAKQLQVEVAMFKEAFKQA